MLLLLLCLFSLATTLGLSVLTSTAMLATKCKKCHRKENRLRKMDHHPDLVLVSLDGLWVSIQQRHKRVHWPNRCHPPPYRTLSRNIPVCYHGCRYWVSKKEWPHCLTDWTRRGSRYRQQPSNSEAVLSAGGTVYDPHTHLWHTMVSHTHPGYVYTCMQFPHS